MRTTRHFLPCFALCLCTLVLVGGTPAGVLSALAQTSASARMFARPPFESQVEEQLVGIEDASAEKRAVAAEALGFLRAYAAEPALIARLTDASPVVRQKAALALAWCGGRESLVPLVAALDDSEWLVRQAAHVALTNLTGMEFPFDATASAARRQAQTRTWRDWIAALPPDRAPQDVLDLLVGPSGVASCRSVTASTTYKGPPDVLTDGSIGPAYWQTKNVDPPQWCMVDLGSPCEINQVVVHQYGPEYVMTDWELSASNDGKTFDSLRREQGDSAVELVIDFPARKARFVRITSHASKFPRYPTTFFEIEINQPGMQKIEFDEPVKWRQERGARALGVIGGPDASRRLIELLGESPPTSEAYRPMVRVAIRSLGRLKQEEGFHYLASLLDNTMWARCAADALGEFGDRRAVAALVNAYPEYCKTLEGRNPEKLPHDDSMGFPSEDRMLETPYFIAYALTRLPQERPNEVAALRRIAPLVMANLPGDHDTFMLYEPEVGHLVTRCLLQRSGLRQQALEHAFEVLGQPRRIPAADDDPQWSVFQPYRMSTWLPALVAEKEDLPRLLALLDHKEGWVRLNAAKAIGWLGAPEAIEPVAAILREAKNEAAHGYSGTFKDEEYNDPAPRWREGLVRCLGLLEANAHADLLISILEDEGSVVDIRHAAASALGNMSCEKAVGALKTAALEHDFHSVRHIARDALRARGIRLRPRIAGSPTDATATVASGGCARHDEQQLESIIFVKGNNSIPNTIGTVEQADRWRQTYAVTDSGPVYRPGRNLYRLSPPRPGGKVEPLTTFTDGYVGEPEISWDGAHLLFVRRGQDDPWWHIWRIDVDGSGLEQLTFGPYHDVGPAYLPDGRIVFSTTRAGIRDEYHGYPCTALWTMDADGSNKQPLATNIGRDNEPAVLADGRIAFSRLEVFYSRNKTELTLHAMHPDGSQDVVLYGPERRRFWRTLDHGPRTPADGQENPLTHRVLRMTQPRPMPDGRHIIVVTQGGLALIGSRRDTEEIITPNNKERSYTTPYPLPDGRILCASTLKVEEREQVDLGLYLFDPETKSVELVYNDPAAADFEPQPVLSRTRPMLQPTKVRPGAYSGRFLCSSVFTTQEEDVPERGRLVRLIEGVPVVHRHSTHTNPWPVWKNHGGTFARVLGMAPLAPDGSFYVEVPADRLMHFQVLDSDRRVLGNQLTWIYPRPGETKSCVGCHENPHTTTAGNDPIASHYPPLDFLPKTGQFTYRAKAWFKGRLPDEIEERTRTVRAVNLMGR